jgi:acetylornithine deacetylase/succinyl-diaminopimelate desuccinylase-like protein
MTRITALLLLLLFAPAAVPADEPTAAQREAREILNELVATDTTLEHGSTTKAAEKLARRLRDAGFPEADVQIVGPEGSVNGNLIARLRGKGKAKPILLLAHLDVVEARREDWSFEPFALTEKDGFFYGRGTLDIKDGAALLVETLLQLKRTAFVPDGDLVLALTAGEEANEKDNGVVWLLAHRRDLIGAGYCINMDAGDPQIRNGQRITRTVQASEKVFASFRLEVTGPGGHSSLPTADNVISRLGAGLGRLSDLTFPARLDEVTRAYFAGLAALETGPAAADMRAAARVPPDANAIARLSQNTFWNAQLRTTCVPTLLEGGHAENALPQRARATVNCRMLPGEDPAAVKTAIEKALRDDRIAVTVQTPANPGPASPLEPKLLARITEVTKRLWPGVVVLPVMETGATDGKFLRAAGIPTYGVSGVFVDVDDIRSHGRDERIGVREYDDAVPYLLELVKAVSAQR